MSRLCDEVIERGLILLYRRDQTNTGSVRLSASLGFAPVVEVDSITRP